MKYKLALTILTSLFLYSSCQKNANTKITSGNTSSDNTILAAKDYFEKNIDNASTQGGSQEVNGATSNNFNHIAALEKTIRWDLASVIQLSKVKMVVVPLFFADTLNSSTNISNGSYKIPINAISRLIIYNGVSGYHALVMSVYPDSNYLKTNSGFTGIATLQDWKGIYLKGLKFENNQTYNLSLGDSTTEDSVQVNTYQLYVTTCYYNDWYNCDATGCVFAYTEALGCSTSPVGSPSGSDEVSDYDYEVLSSSDPSVLPIVVDTIGNLLNIPCLKNALANLINGGFKAELSALLLNTFGSTNTDENIVFKNLPEPDDFGTANTTSRTNVGGGITYIDATTILNSNQLQNASQEFITETIFHEAIHAYLSSFPLTQSAVNQHATMMQSYAGCEVAALQEIFPSLPTHDALCIILGGMGDEQKADPAVFNSVLASYNLTLTDVNATNASYENGSKGTVCPGGLN